MRTFTEKQNQDQPLAAGNLRRPSLTPPGKRQGPSSLPQSQHPAGGQAGQGLLGDSVGNLEAGFADTLSSRFAHEFSRIPLHSPSPLPIQAKLAISNPGDSYEQEADRIADTVMRKPQSQGGCGCAGACPKCQAEQAVPGLERLQIQRVGSGEHGPGEVPPIVHDVLRSSGQPIDPATRASMEMRFGHDFSGVRLHADERAGRSAQAINALAYTVGNHIAFAPNQYQPHSSAGLRLFAHELTHVVQQSGAAAPLIQRQPAFPKKGIKVTGPDAKELASVLSVCTGIDISLDKDDMLQDSGKKNSSKNTSGVAKKQVLSLIKNPNGLLIDTDRDVVGAMIGSYRAAHPGFHNVNIQQIKALAGATGADGGLNACSAILHEISEAANARALDVKGKTSQADTFKQSHDYGIDIENKIRADFKLPARNTTGDMMVKMIHVQDKSYLLSLHSNNYGSGKELRTQLNVIKTSYTVANNKPQVLGNEVLASHVEMGAVDLSTTVKAIDAFKKFFPTLPAKLDLPDL